MNSSHSCDVIAIASDEAPYIAEFVHHYIYLGFSNIYIGINNSQDSTELILKKISTYYPQVKIINVDEAQSQGMQSRSYEELWNIARGHTTASYCLFVDVDEFWVAPPFPTMIPDFIQLNEPFDVFSFHWVNCFGGNEFSPPLAGDYLAALDPHVKSIIAYSANVELLRCHAPILIQADHAIPICKNSHIGQYDLDSTTNLNELPELVDATTMARDKATGLGVIMHRYQRSELEYAYRLFKPTAVQANTSPFKDNRWGYNRDVQQGISPPFKLLCKEDLDILTPNDSINAYHKSLGNFLSACGINSILAAAKHNISEESIVKKIDEISTGDLSTFKDAWYQAFKGTKYLQNLRKVAIQNKYYQAVETSRKIDVLFIGHDAFNAGSQRALLWLITELRLQHPELSLGLLLLEEGSLINAYAAECSLSIVSLNDIQSGDHDLLAHVFPKPGATVISNSVVSLPALLQLRKLLGDDFCQWGLWIHELPDTVKNLALLNTLEQATNKLNFIVTPSPLAEDLWKQHLMHEQELVKTSLLHKQNWVLIPPNDIKYELSNADALSIKPRWPDKSSCRILGFGRDQESFERFRFTIRDLRRIIPDAVALWVGPIGAEEPGLTWMLLVDVTLALQQASLFVLTTGGSAKSGESFGLIAAESLMVGCPMLSVGAPPLGVAHWWPKELKLDLAMMNQKELLERIQATYEGGNKERLRRRLLAQPYLTKLARDRRLGIKQLVQICYPSVN